MKKTKCDSRIYTIYGPTIHFVGYGYFWAVIVAQLVERSLTTPEVRGLNPIIGKFLCRAFVYCELYCIEKTKKRPGMAHF